MKISTWFSLFALFFFSLTETALGQNENELKPLVSEKELKKYPPGLGDYGKWHGKAHEKGVVKKTARENGQILL